MDRPKLTLDRKPSGEYPFFELSLEGGNDPGAAVRDELFALVEKHALNPAGGCIDNNAIAPDGKVTHFPIGLKIQASKYDDVVADLHVLGYTVVES